MDPSQALCLTLWMLTLPYLQIMFLFYQNRQKHPLKGRYPRVALVQGLSVFAFASMQWVRIQFGANCIAVQYLSWTFNFIMQGSFNYRLVQLLFAFQITQDIAKLRDKKQVVDWTPNWFTRHREMAQNPFIFKVVIGLLIAYGIIFITLPADSIDPCGRLFSTLFQIRGGLGGLFSVFLGLQMWGFPSDAFGMKTEFKFTAGTPFVLVGISLILNAILKSRTSALLDALIIIACHPILFFCIGRPWWQSTRQTVNKAGEEAITLKAWLLNPEGVTLFYDYLKTEFSSENLLFWLEVNAYQTLLQRDLPFIKEHADQIWKKFVDRNAPCCVNLPADTWNQVSTSMRDLMSQNNQNGELISPEDALHIFGEAQLEIYRLMASDSFPRFQQTAIYAERKGSLSPARSYESHNELATLLEAHSPNTTQEPQPEDEAALSASLSTPSRAQSHSGSPPSPVLSGNASGRSMIGSGEEEPLAPTKL